MALGTTSSVSYRYRSRIDSGCRNGAQAADTAVVIDWLQKTKQGGNNKNQRREGKVVTRQKRWGELEHKEQLDANRELEKIRQLLRELSDRVKAVPLRKVMKWTKKG